MTRAVGARSSTCSSRRRSTRTSRFRRHCPRSSRSTTRSPIDFPSSRCRRARASLLACKVQMALAQSTLVLTVSDYAATRGEPTLGVRRDRMRVAVEAAAPVYQPSDGGGSACRRARRRRARRPSLVRLRRRVQPAQARRPHRSRARGARADARGRDDRAVARARRDHDADTFYGVAQGIRDEIARCGTADQVRWAGYVPDDELRHLLSGAVALVLPSETEGFGLPAVEAAACGVPVIATTESPLPQLLEGGGFFVAPGDTAALGDRHAAALDRRARTASAPSRSRAPARLSWRERARDAAALDAPVDRARPPSACRRERAPVLHVLDVLSAVQLRW